MDITDPATDAAVQQHPRDLDGDEEQQHTLTSQVDNDLIDTTCTAPTGTAQSGDPLQQFSTATDQTQKSQLDAANVFNVPASYANAPPPTTTIPTTAHHHNQQHGQSADGAVIPGGPAAMLQPSAVETDLANIHATNHLMNREIPHQHHQHHQFHRQPAPPPPRPRIQQQLYPPNNPFLDHNNGHL
ncbi:hypothetical protein AJ80_09180, partial [Polytolypa hystricis UAMH7299]